MQSGGTMSEKARFSLSSDELSVTLKCLDHFIERISHIEEYLTPEESKALWTARDEIASRLEKINNLSSGSR
jgi:hypothetical protein